MTQENTIHAHVAETGESPYAVDIQVSGHRFKGDEPASGGGSNLGPAPYDMLLAALGECTAMTVRWYALRQNWPLVKVEVNLTYRKEDKTDIFTKQVIIHGDMLSEEQRKKLVDVAAKCPVQRTLEGASDHPHGTGMKKRQHKQQQNTPRHIRLVARGDGFKVVSTGRRKQGLSDLYARLLGASWKKMILIMATVYLSLNVLFALAYLAIGDGIDNAHKGSFADAFFFSVQTISTIGYGNFIPHGLVANLLVTLESMFGFAFYGLVTGLVFTRFSRPTARILFSDKAVMTTHDGKRHFMLRLANERDNRIVDTSAKLTLMRDEKSKEGTLMRRFYDLPLVRKEIPVLRLTWTVMHEIDERSPLYGITHEKLAETESEIIISISGMDETLSQTVHARHSYIADEIFCDAAFEDILYRREDYVLEVRYDRFHQLKISEQ